MGNDEAKLFVAGLPESVSEDMVREWFQSTGGTVLQVSLPRHRDTGRPRGIGFVTMSSAAEAETARGALDGSLQMGKSILVRPYQSDPPKRDGSGPPMRSDRAAGPGGPMGMGGGMGGPRREGGPGAAPPPDRQLYIGNLPYDCTQQEIESLVNSVAEGQVMRVNLPSDPDGRKRGFGFVWMSSTEGAKAAIEGLQDLDLRGRKLNIKIAQPRGERPAFGGGGGGGFSGGGGGFSGGGGGFAGGPPAAGFAPPPQRKTFDERRKGKHGGGFDDGPKKRRFDGGDAGGGKRGGGGGGRVDWEKDDD